MLLTADVFVLHDGEILLLRRRGLGEGLWYIPGGIVELGEDPLAAAARETLEESALEVTDLQLLRVWSYEVEPGRWAYHATYKANAPHRDVMISDEHSGWRWCAPQHYIDTDLAAWAAVDHPVLDAFAPQVLTNVRILMESP